jgi:hypothetical protein
MPRWIPQWHPFVWILVLVLIYGIWHDPAAWGARVHGLLGYIPLAAARIGTFITHI